MLPLYLTLMRTRQSHIPHPFMTVRTLTQRTHSTEKEKKNETTNEKKLPNAQKKKKKRKKRITQKSSNRFQGLLVARLHSLSPTLVCHYSY